MTPTERLDHLTDARDGMEEAGADPAAIDRMNDRILGLYTDASLTGELDTEPIPGIYRLHGYVIRRDDAGALGWLYYEGPEAGVLSGRAATEEMHGLTVLVLGPWKTRSNRGADLCERQAELPLWQGTDFFIVPAFGWNQLYRCDTGGPANAETERIYKFSRAVSKN